MKTLNSFRFVAVQNDGWKLAHDFVQIKEFAAAQRFEFSLLNNLVAEIVYVWQM